MAAGWAAGMGSIMGIMSFSIIIMGSFSIMSSIIIAGISSSILAACGAGAGAG